MSKKEAVAGPELVDIGPELILADANVRYNLKRTRLDTLKAAIMEAGRVTEPIEIEPLETPVGKAIYRLTVGHYRHAAVTELNKEGAGLLLPAQVVATASPLKRLERQISENLDREDFSPMDKAIAMKALLDLGMSKADVRARFGVPGGRKGMKVQPLSNSSVNIHLSFLDFSKAIQEKIHDGRIGILGAMELVKAKPEKRAEIIETIETERLAQISIEEKDEEKFLAQEAKAEEAKAKVDALESKVKDTEAELAKAVEAEKVKAAEAASIYKQVQGITDDKIKLSAEGRLKAAQAEAEKAGKAREALEAKAKKAAETLKEKLAAAKTKADALKVSQAAAKKAANKPVTAKEIAKVAKAVGGDTEETSGLKPLNRTEIMKCLAELTLPGSDAKVAQIANAFTECFNSIITDKALYKRLKAIVAAK